jgi:nicotinamidase-related amidase
MYQVLKKDCDRLAAMITRLGKRIDDIHVTLDSHHIMDIAHPGFWRDSDGNKPAPFTIITVDDVSNGKFRPFSPALNARVLDYVKSLKDNDRYDLCIWPEHCLIGSTGYSVYPSVYGAISEWERENSGMVNYVTKGSNIFTEHYSAIQADVPDAADPGTMLNTGLIDTLSNAGVIAVGGQASSHCVANTLRDIVKNFGADNAKKIVLLEDCMSAVPGFEQLETEFFTEMKNMGVTITTSTEFMK